MAGFKVDQATLHLAVRQQKAGDMKFEAGTMVDGGGAGGECL